MGESASVEVNQLRQQGIAPPLNRIADHCAIFLDFDGTLMNLERRHALLGPSEDRHDRP